MTTMGLKTPRILAGILLSAAVLFAITVRCRLASFPMERDEGEYAYAGQLLLNGIPPYKYAHNMKLPGTYLAYAGMMAVFGQTTEGVHYGMLTVNLATVLLLYILTRSLFDGITAGSAAIIYAILSISDSVVGMTGHATHFVAFFGLAGSTVLWRCLRVSDWRLAVSSGLLFGLAFLMKQQGVFLIVFGGACFFERILRERQTALFFRLRDLVVFTAGAIAPYLIICLWLWYAGVWQSFKFWTIEYAAQYVQVIPWQEGFFLAIGGTMAAIGKNILLWLLAFLGFVALIDEIVSQSNFVDHPLNKEHRSSADRADCLSACWFLCGYTAFSAACVLPGLIFRSQYYVVMLPPLAILGGAGCRMFGFQNEHSVLRQRWRHWWNSSAALTDYTTIEHGEPALPEVEPPSIPTTTAMVTSDDRYLSVTLLFLAVVPTVLFQSDYLFFSSPMRLCRQVYGTNPFPESPAIAAYIRKHTADTDTIAVVGSEPQLYFLSQRRSCTGYIYTYPLVEPQPFARQMQEEMIREIEHGAPAVIVDVQISMSWARRNDETLIFEWKSEYLKEHYKCVGVVDIVPKQATVFRWNRDVESYSPKSDNLIKIYERI
jgi:hypothetical protein